MDPALWSRLPQEILSGIIENTADSETLKSWVEATNDSVHLHPVALRKTYSTFTICEKDLLRAAGVASHCDWYISTADDEASDDETGDGEASGDEANDDEANDHEASDGEASDSASSRDERAKSEPRSSSYRIFAPHIRRLHLQIYFDSGDRRDDLSRSDAIRNALDIILPEVKDLQEIDHYGAMYEDVMDGILEVPSLKTLRIRQSGHDVSYFRSDRSRGLCMLDWSTFFQGHSLKNLTVSQLHLYEAPGLAMAIKRLRKLETLRVETAKSDMKLLVNFEHCTMMAFIDELYRRKRESENEDPGFPSSLKALALVNVHYGYFDLSRLPKNLAPPLQDLATLYLDLFDSEELTNVLSFLNPHNLVHLLVSTYPKPETIRIRTLHNSCPHDDTFRNLLGQNSETLREITLLNAWQDTRENGRDIQPPWISDMKLHQMYLSKPSTRGGPRNRVGPEISNRLAWRLHGADRSGDFDWKVWSEGIRHIRVDQLDLAKLVLYDNDQAVERFSHLKILVLRSQTEQVRFRPPSTLTRSTPYPYLPFGPTLPEDVTSLREGQIACELSTRNLPDLRVIVVGEFKFWLQRLAKGKDHDDQMPNCTVWFLRRALEDPDQEGVILQTMDKDDWDFLADREDSLPASAPKEQVHWANRLVYRSKAEKIEG